MSGTAEPLFLTRDQVVGFHRQQMERFGGAEGLIDSGLLESALAQPQTTWCYNPGADIFDLASAYAFHLAKNHAFRDGNKRVALHSALAFLHVNGVSVASSQEEMFQATMRLVTSIIDKTQFAEFLRIHSA